MARSALLKANPTPKITRTPEHVTKYVEKLKLRLNDMELEFVTPIPKLVEQLCGCTDDLIHFKTYFRRITPGHEYTHQIPVGIDGVLGGSTQIWSDEDKQAKHVVNLVDKWCTKLTDMELKFVTPIPELIEQLRNCGYELGDFKTQFRRTTPGHEYTHPTPVQIGYWFVVTHRF